MTDKSREAGIAAPYVLALRSEVVQADEWIERERYGASLEATTTIGALIEIAEGRGRQVESLRSEVERLRRGLDAERGYRTAWARAADSLRSEVERLRDMNNLRLLSAGPEKGGRGFRMRLKDPTGAAAILAATFKAELDRLGAENYVEMHLRDHDCNRYVVTVKRENGKTPPRDADGGSGQGGAAGRGHAQPLPRPPPAAEGRIPPTRGVRHVHGVRAVASGARGPRRLGGLPLTHARLPDERRELSPDQWVERVSVAAARCACGWRGPWSSEPADVESAWRDHEKLAAAAPREPLPVPYVPLRMRHRGESPAW